jgi:hypothetical protein
MDLVDYLAGVCARDGSVAEFEKAREWAGLTFPSTSDELDRFRRGLQWTWYADGRISPRPVPAGLGVTTVSVETTIRHGVNSEDTVRRVLLGWADD